MNAGVVPPGEHLRPQSRDRRGTKKKERRPTADPLSLIVQRPVQALNPERIYLFGSRARGEADPDSDYDILVVVADNQEPRYVRAQAGYRALWGVGVPVDLLVLTHQEFEREIPVIASLPAVAVREERLLYPT